MASAAPRICLDKLAFSPAMARPPPTLRSSIPDRIMPIAPGIWNCAPANTNLHAQTPSALSKMPEQAAHACS